MHCFRRACHCMLLLMVVATSACTGTARADDAAPKPEIHIAHATGAIVIDGNFDDAGWQGVTPETTWYETNVSDNQRPPVGTAAYLSYDEHFLYVWNVSEA